MCKKKLFVTLWPLLIVSLVACVGTTPTLDNPPAVDDGTRFRLQPSQTEPAFSSDLAAGSDTPAGSATNVCKEASDPQTTPSATLPPEEPTPDDDSFQPVSIIKFNPGEIVTALVWSPDGSVLAVAAGDKVYLHDAQNFGRLGNFQVGSLTYSLAFSPAGDLLAAGSRDGLVRVWMYEDLISDPEDPGVGLLWVLEAHKKGVNSVAFSVHGKYLASGGNDAVVRLWDTETGAVAGTLIGGTYAVPAIAFDPSGELLAIVNGDVIRLRDIETQQIWGTIRAPTHLYGITYSPDGSRLVSSDINNNIYLWDPERAYRSGVEIYPEPLILRGHAGRENTYQALIWDVAFHPGGVWLASAGGDGSVRLWDIVSGTLINTISDHSAGVTSVAFNPDGSRLASGGLDGIVYVWEVDQ
jgi:WD40 repeat protein